MTQAVAARRRSDWPAITAVFVLVLGFTYTDDAVEFAVDLAGREPADWRWLVIALDLALVGGTALLKWHMTARPRDPGTFARNLLTGWWAVGATAVVAIHLMLLGTASSSHRWSVADSPMLTLLTNFAFVVAMGVLLISALGGSKESRGWILPVVIGTFVVQVAAALWYPVINVNPDCANEVSTAYFNGMVEVLPVFLITLGLEVNYLRNSGAVREAGQRAVPVLTVVLLCVAEALAFSILVRTHTSNCGIGAVWHEYVAFVATVHAAAISLATLAWLLLSNPAPRT